MVILVHMETPTVLPNDYFSDFCTQNDNLDSKFKN